ncbi:MAG: potassium channel family protein [Candidatus Puniceispirillales bacterium]
MLEHEAQPDKFSSIPQTMWWSLITLTTVGYGDVSPVTPIGQVIGAITALMGVCVVALLTGIVASAFSNQMSQRKIIIEAEIASALSDGVLSEDELIKIEKLRREFHLSEQHVDALIKILKEQEHLMHD